MNQPALTSTAAKGLFDLTGKVAIVTGGNGGIGLGMALGLAKAGASVAIAARRRDKAEAAEAALAEIGAKTLFIETDVGSRESCFAMVETAVAHFGRVDILIANAAIAPVGPPEDMTEADWRNTIDINLGGMFFACQAVHPHMKAQGGGKIVTTGSLASVLGARFAVSYAASKGGARQLTRSLAIAWAPDGIQVNGILPGYTVTDLMADAKANVDGLDATVCARTPAGRWGLPADFEGAAVFLCSRASDFITGESIMIDGGFGVAGLI